MALRTPHLAVLTSLLLACSNGFGGKGKDPDGINDPAEGAEGGADGSDGADGASDGGEEGADGSSDGGTDGASDGGVDGSADGGTEGGTEGGTDGGADASDGSVDPATTDDDGDGLSEEEGDCDDTDGSVSPEVDEEPYDGVDNDCSRATPDDDLDGDGADAASDCDDLDDAVGPAAEELPYDGVDNDCDSDTPDDDLDGDGVLGVDDCDDTDASASPELDEVLSDGVDNNCDGQVDERFSVTVVDDSCDCGWPSAIDVDSVGQVHLAYFDADNGWLRYATRSSAGAWDSGEVLVDTAGAAAGEYMDGKVDLADRFQLTYTWWSAAADTTELDFMYRESDGSWSEEFVVEDGSTTGSTDIGYFVTMELDGDNLPSFLYFDYENGVPVIADLMSGPWLYFGIDAIYSQVDINWTGPTGYYTSLDIDSTGYDHIAYYDDGISAGEAQYGIPGEAVFSQPIEADGIFTSIRLMSDDTPCVAWQKSTTADLRFGCSTDGGDSWTVSTVDSSGDVGSYAQLAFNSLDEPYIAYYDATGKNLKLASRSGSSWTITTVDSTGDVGRAVDMAIDDDDRVHLSWYDYTNQRLKYAVGR